MILDLGIERETSRPPAPRNSAYLFIKIIFIIVIIIIIMCMAIIMMMEMFIDTARGQSLRPQHFACSPPLTREPVVNIIIIISIIIIIIIILVTVIIISIISIFQVTLAEHLFNPNSHHEDNS